VNNLTETLGMRGLTAKITACKFSDAWYKNNINSTYNVVWEQDMKCWAVLDSDMELYGIPDKLIHSADCVLESITSLEDKTIDEIESELLNVKRERDSKGPDHSDYPMANAMLAAIEKAIKNKRNL